MTTLEKTERVMRDKMCWIQMHVSDPSVRVLVYRGNDIYAHGHGESLEAAMVDALSEMGEL